MNHRTIFHRIAWNWNVHGIPRCAAWFALPTQNCRGLIWPWQRTGGNSEDVEHYACMIRERRENDESDRMEDAKR